MLSRCSCAAIMATIKTRMKTTSMAMSTTTTATTSNTRAPISQLGTSLKAVSISPMASARRNQHIQQQKQKMLVQLSSRRTLTTAAASSSSSSSSSPPPPPPPRPPSPRTSSWASKAAALLAAAALGLSAVQPAEAFRFGPFSSSSSSSSSSAGAAEAEAEAADASSSSSSSFSFSKRDADEEGQNSRASTSAPPATATAAATLTRQLQQQRQPSSSLDMVPPSPELDRDLSADELAAVRLFRAATPSVVNIANLVSVRGQGYGSMDAMRVPQGTGSGFVWNKSGILVTNYHVVRGADEIKVALIDSSVWSAKFIAGDPDKDVAVLQLLAPKEVVSALKPVTIGSSAGLQVGQKTYALGNPFGLDHSMSTGIISGLGRELASPGYRGTSIRGIIQTDAAINPGNSGGVLLDSRGRLIGINTAIADPTGKGASSGVGFAIPIDTVRGLVEQILTYGKIVRPVLGITIAPPQTLRQIGEEGVLVLDVPQGTPAAAAGIRGTARDDRGRLVLGDIITSVDGKAVRSQKDLFALLDERRPGDKIRVGVTRDDRRGVEVDVILGGRELGRDE